MAHRQVRPAVARRIAASVRAAIERKKELARQTEEQNRRDIADSGIRIRGPEPTPAEIRKARQMMNRRRFAESIDFTLPH